MKKKTYDKFPEVPEAVARTVTHRDDFVSLPPEGSKEQKELRKDIERLKGMMKGKKP